MARHHLDQPPHPGFQWNTRMTLHSLVGYLDLNLLLRVTLPRLHPGWVGVDPTGIYVWLASTQVGKVDPISISNQHSSPRIPVFSEVFQPLVLIKVKLSLLTTQGFCFPKHLEPTWRYVHMGWKTLKAVIIRFPPLIFKYLVKRLYCPTKSNHTIIML